LVKETIGLHAARDETYREHAEIKHAFSLVCFALAI
jgi:hypothetical protein